MNAAQTTATAAPFKVGDRVKRSEYALRPIRSSWLQAGSYTAKSAAKDELDRETAKRGTVTACDPGRHCGFTVCVQIDDGGAHYGMPYLWEAAQ